MARHLNAEVVTSSGLDLREPRVCGDEVWWVESNPSEAGRSRGMRRRADGEVVEVTPPPFDVRSRVYEYGGGAWLVRGDAFFFSHLGDGQLYRATQGGAARAVSERPGARYADLAWDAARGLLLGVRELPGEDERALVAFEAERPGAPEQVLLSTVDFCAAPRASPDGGRLAWLSWRAPDMPWDASELWVAARDARGALCAHQRLTAPGESVCQPEWAPDGALYFVSDRGGFWNLYRWDGAHVEPVAPMEAELARPAWFLRWTCYGLDPHGNVVCTYSHEGRWRLGRIRPGGGLEPVESPFAWVADLHVSGAAAAFVAGAPDLPNAVVRWNLRDDAFEFVRRSAPQPPSEALSAPRPFSFSAGRGRRAFGHFYPPAPGLHGKDRPPPVMVTVHGGPTDAASLGFRPRTQYWAERGVAVFDLNYTGSTGYGRAYREALYGQWGVVDVEDCLSALEALGREGRVDPSRAVVWGASSGGLTVLLALARAPHLRGGIVHFGVTDLEAFARDTHGFEAHYVRRLVGGPQALVERSPVNLAAHIRAPVLFFQGAEDKVVLPEQTRRMVERLEREGGAPEYWEFPGERHSFRRRDSLLRAFEAEGRFLRRVLELSAEAFE